MRKQISKFMLMFLVVFSLLIISDCRNTLAQTSILSVNNLNGIVTDKNNKPLEFVSVFVNDLGLTSATDSKGRFSFNGISNGSHILTFKLSGYASRSLDVNLTGNDTLYSILLEESLIEIPVIDVTGSFNASEISESTFSITELTSRTITKSRSQNLAETIQNIPGISNVSTGTGIGKPVIRGLTSQSVLVIHDGVKQESQSWGDEHGPELSLFDLDRIEILRGPASLVYGADGIGGVINVISKPLEFSNIKRPVYYGGFTLGGFSVDKQYFTNGTLGFGTKNFGLKGHFGYRKSGNTITPDGTFTINTPEGKKEIQGGELFNSASKELEGGVNLGINGNFGMMNLGFELFDRELQIHEDPLEDSEATPNQKVQTKQFSLESNINLSAKLKLEPVLSYQLQTRKEFESIEDKSAVNEALHLDLKTFDGALKLHHEFSSKMSGTFGVSFNRQDNKTLVEEKLIPNYYANTTGVFLMEKLDLSKITFSAGARFDNKKLNIEETVFEMDSTGNPLRTLTPQSITFEAVSGSFGIVYTPSEYLNIFANIGRGWRPPSEFELFVDGVHEGTGRYERGIKTLNTLAEPKPEASINSDLGIRLNYKQLSIQISAYRNMVDNFIYPSITGDTIDGLPVFNIKQSMSTFYGYEYSVQYQPVKWIVLMAGGDYVNTLNNATGNPLPFTPPMKNIFELKVQRQNLGSLLNAYFKLSAKIVSAQDNVDILETRTAGYTLLNAGIGFDLCLAGSIASLDLSIDNLADTKYVDHLSRYKGYAMNPGRSFNLQLNLPFRF
ncbi:MAG: TonB-dependent receptor [Ignavibacteria bacterium]|nr:TonB-dependent receptor [Ignavibacteria bacterium]